MNMVRFVQFVIVMALYAFLETVIASAIALELLEGKGVDQAVVISLTITGMALLILASGLSGLTLWWYPSIVCRKKNA